MAFLKNYWYAAAWSDEVAPGAVLARRILGDEMVLFRGEGGRAATLTDRCPHRLLPLSCGRVQGEHLECGYHGLTFDAHGVCVRIPAQDRIPPGARVRSYPTVERHGVIWVWTGDPARADPAEIFDVLHSGSADWARGQVHLTYATHYLNVTDNLVDPAHTSFVHRRTLGGAAATDIPVSTTQQGEAILVTRWIEDSPPVPMMRKFFSFTGNVDRWQYYYWYQPPVLCVDFGAIDAGRPRTEEEKDRGFRVYSYSFVTPETVGSTHCFSLQLRNFAVGDAAAGRELLEDFRLTYEEDRVILERIQMVQEQVGKTHEIRIGIDAAAVQVRGRHERLLAEQAAQVADAPACP